MALPPQAVERLVQDPSSTQGAYKQFLILGISLFILMVVLYAGIAFGYTAYLQGAVDNLDKQIQDFATRTPVDQQAQAAGFYSQLINLRQLLKSHTAASPALTLLERTASPDIYYTKLNLNSVTNEMDLNGVARTLDAAAAEAAMLQVQPEVARVNFTNASQIQNQGQSQTGWQFSISVFFNPGVLQGISQSVGTGSTAPTAPAPAAATTTATSTGTK